MQTKKITIIGNGQIGQAIAYLLKKDAEKYTIEIYDKDEQKNESKKTLNDCLLGADFIFLCIPSWCLKEILKEVSSIKINPETILISLSKGIDVIKKESVDEMIEKTAKKAKYALLYGPMFAEEILNDKKSFGVIASKDKKVFEKISKLFTNTKLKLEYSNKVRSVAMSGVLKNVYTLATSIINISSEENNTKGILFTNAVKEMEEIMAILKLDKKTILGTSGLADFFATVSNKNSQNTKVGIEITTNGNTLIKSEGLISLSPLIGKLGKKSKNLPMLSLLETIILKKKDPKAEIENFLKQI